VGLLPGTGRAGGGGGRSVGVGVGRVGWSFLFFFFFFFGARGGGGGGGLSSFRGGVEGCEEGMKTSLAFPVLRKRWSSRPLLFVFSANEKESFCFFFSSDFPLSLR